MVRKSKNKGSGEKVEKPKGLVCPRCGCRDLRDESGRPAGFDTVKTVKIPRGIRRYRICRNCGRRIRTREVIEKN